MIKTFALAAALCAAGPALSAPRCELALLFAVDVSASISPAEYATQIEGLVSGLNDGIVADAIVRQQASLALLQWSGHASQHLSIGWTTINGHGDLEAFRSALQGVQRNWMDQPTALGAAMLYAVDAFTSAPACLRQVVDVSGDGRSNEGILPQNQRAALEARGITVNALAIETDDEGLSDYYSRNVIVGHDSFVYTAYSYEEFGVVMREKLMRELAVQLASNAMP